MERAPVDNAVFDYEVAFQRNIGFLSPSEQQRLRSARVAVAGLGGTGGAQVQALARMGIGAFNLADPDTFELVNFNRQAGAFMHTIGHKKTAVAREVACSINPEANVQTFDEGISADNIDGFLEGVDVVVDSLDFYCFEERFVLYERARQRGLWVLTAPPLGFGFTLLNFDPQGMTFEDYFGFRRGMAERDLVISLIAGIAPRPFLLRYLRRGSTELGGRRLPSVGAAPFMIAGVIATEVVNLLTDKASRFAVPAVYQFDAMLRVMRRKTYRWGMRTPLQIARKALLARMLPK